MTKNIKTKQSTMIQINFNVKVIIRISMTILGTIILLYGRWIIMGGHTPAFKAIDNPAAFSDSLFTKVRKRQALKNLFISLRLFLYAYHLTLTTSNTALKPRKRPRIFESLLLTKLHIFRFHVYLI